MDKKKLSQEIKQGKWNSILSASAVNILESMQETEIKKALDEITEVPINYAREISGELYRLYFTAAWVEVFKNLDKKDKDLDILEIASGQSDPVPQGLEIYSEGKGSYTTANLNKALTQGLLSKTEALKIEVRVIEDNAINLENYFDDNNFDLTAFQHAINDMIQTIIAQEMDLDTINNDWFDILPEMVQGVTKHYQEGTLREVAYEDFIKQIQVCTNLLKKGGILAFNTHVFQMDLDCGYLLELYSNFVEIARVWISTSDLELQEVNIEGFDKKWWLFLKKV